MSATLSRRLFLALSAGLLAACAPKFETSYSTPVTAEVAQGWTVSDVSVTVPDTLSVSEARTIFPRADIVWREDPPGDRRAQVGQIVGDAARSATAGLKGPRKVRLLLTLERFHALTFEAETRLSNAGVHNIDFVAEVVDAASGERLAGPDDVKASLPALSGVEMVAARARGESQKSQITAHLVAVFQGWFGLGPDPRGSFTRLGG